MVADWYDRLTLSSELRPAAEGVEARYRLLLRNDSDQTLRDFRLGFSGPGYVSPGSEDAVFDRLVFPRLSAIAETGWSHHRDWRRFKALVGLMPNLYGQYEGL